MALAYWCKLLADAWPLDFWRLIVMPMHLAAEEKHVADGCSSASE